MALQNRCMICCVANGSALTKFMGFWEPCVATHLHAYMHAIRRSGVRARRAIRKHIHDFVAPSICGVWLQHAPFGLRIIHHRAVAV